MVKFLIEKLARLYAGKIAGYIAIAITFAVLKGTAWLAAHYPPIAALCDPQAIADWLSVAVAAIVNDLANRASKDAGAAEAMQAVAADLQADPAKIPVVKAEPVDKP